MSVVMHPTLANAAMRVIEKGQQVKGGWEFNATPAEVRLLLMALRISGNKDRRMTSAIKKIEAALSACSDQSKTRRRGR